MFDHVNTIIGENKTYRMSGFFGSLWPTHYLVIGCGSFANLILPGPLQR